MMEEVDLEGGPDPSPGGPVHPPEGSILKDSNPTKTGPTDTPDLPEKSTDIKINREAEEGECNEASDHISQVIQALYNCINKKALASWGKYG